MGMRDKLEQVSVKTTLFPELEYIEKGTLLNKLCEDNCRHEFEVTGGCNNCYMVEMILEAPSADVAPVRHGRWVVKPTGRYGQWQAWCSECNERCGCGGTIESQHKRFCPNCGARMDLEETL